MSGFWLCGIPFSDFILAGIKNLPKKIQPVQKFYQNRQNFKILQQKISGRISSKFFVWLRKKASPKSKKTGNFELNRVEILLSDDTKDMVVDFADFSDFYGTKPWPHINPHFDSIAAHCDICSFKYDYIIKVSIQK